MGFDLLNNENRLISINNESIQLVGVENWGAGRWFPKKGDLDIATSGVADDQFSILMSHDPTHWDEKVLQHKKHIHLTLVCITNCTKRQH
jgi:predicted MPP superfamily phosphohydrolase